MAIIAVKAWYIEEYEPLQKLEQRPHDLRLSKSSLLRSGFRADFLDEAEEVKQSAWFQRYLEGESVEFYIEGSGAYAICNIDLISHEIYFTKRDVLAQLDPTIFFCYQTEYQESSSAIRDELQAVVERLNTRSRLPLALEESHRLSEGPLRLKSTLMRKLRKSLLFIADGTPISQLPGTPPQLLPSPKVCVEMGYALQCKRSEQIILVQMERSDLPGQFPFDLPGRNRVTFRTPKDLHKELPSLVETQLQRFNLWH